MLIFTGFVGIFTDKFVVLNDIFAVVTDVFVGTERHFMSLSLLKSLDINDILCHYSKQIERKCENMINREKNTAFYTHEETIIDQTTGEVLSSVCKTITKTSSEPD